jgi:hypothetical protein
MNIRFYVDPATGQPHIYKHSTETADCLPQTRAQDTRMSDRNFPAGWDEGRVRRVLEHYERQTPEEAVAEDEAGFENQDETVMRVPHDLVPAVRELIARHQE